MILDTNVVAEALLPGEDEHVECAALMKALGDAGTTVVFNDILELELWEVLFNAALRQRHSGKKLRYVRYDNRVRPRAAKLLEQGQKSWAELLTTWTYSRVKVDEVAADVPAVMKKYGFQSYDAVHAATILATGIPDFVSRDLGFSKMKPTDAQLHTTKSRLRNTRQRRLRAGY